MSVLPALIALSLLSGPARAEDAAPAQTAGWSRQANSLLLRDQDGSLSEEIPLHAPEGSGATSHETIGGTAPDARLAWTLERKLVWTPGRTKLLESRRLFKTYGTSGQELWRDEAVDAPERGEPVLFSNDGKTLLLARRTDAGWSAEARTWLGQPIAALGPFPRLISMALTPNGRYALARWGVPDKSDTHTFIDLSSKERRDIPSSDLILGIARIGDDGVVRTGTKRVLSFETVASTAAPAVPSTATAPVQPAEPR